MKIAFFGGVIFSLEILKTILKNNFSVDIVFSYDESKKKFYSDYVSFDEITQKYGITNIKVQKTNDERNIRFLKKIQPDLILVMGWSHLLKDEILKIPKLGIIGSHPTELPKYRGRTPISWSIIKDLKESALTFFYITEGADEGDILDQRKFQITNKDDAESLYKKITNLGKEMIVYNLPLLEKGAAPRIKQDPSKFIEYWQKRDTKDGLIDWSKSGKEIHNLVRATTHPYPGAFTFFKSSKIKIWKADYLDELSQGVGKIMDVKDGAVKIGTGKGVLLLHKISINDVEHDANKIFSKNDICSNLGT